MSAIPQTLNISNSRTTCAKSINLHTTRKLIEYSSKNEHVKAVSTLTVFKIVRSYRPPSVVQGAKGLMVIPQAKKNFKKRFNILD